MVNETQEIEKKMDFKNNSFSLKKIKKIITSDGDVDHMINREVPIIFVRVCELFILKHTQQSWSYTEERTNGKLSGGTMLRLSHRPLTC
ncbi:hypothetical protein ZOSMA_218G00060 [Zostera marina]|uniref:Transcription factor CBF/NF-Y/archaeal histone domain-containing protein n=1 Tax=Zostera marina TaxID=29655 RepID=A0A0K9PM35_ZOSMR|nr:hypothetical protein ZOSMA_218G00060 [Zostera marina]